MGVSGSTGPEAVAAAEKNAAILTARAGARDPSVIPSICRISAALQYPAGEFSSSFQCVTVLLNLVLGSKFNFPPTSKMVFTTIF